MKKNKMKKFSMFVILTFICYTTYISNVSAYISTPTSEYGYHMTWNIEKIYYYLTSGATEYANIIADAAHNWVKTGLGTNKLYPCTRTTNKTGSAVDFYAEEQGYDAIDAVTYLYKRINGGEKIMVDWVPISNRNNSGVPAENYLFAEIYLNKTIFKDYTTKEKQGTVGHEFGHAWGLGHNNEYKKSLMCQLAFGREVNTVQQVDQDAFNRLYK